MENHARKFIDAVQNSLIGILPARLVSPLFYLALLTSTSANNSSSRVELIPVQVMIAVLVCLPVLIFMVWLVGYLANKRPSSGSALERLHKPPANGFDAWRELPVGGLQPPKMMRSLAVSLGRPLLEPWLATTIRVLAAVGATLAIFVTFSGASWITQIFPGWTPADYRAPALWTYVFVVFAIVVRSSAVELRDRLLRPEDLSPS